MNEFQTVSTEELNQIEGGDAPLMPVIAKVVIDAAIAWSWRG
jgi:lactobin A/cerein 7B family class IIb bacteriocin